MLVIGGILQIAAFFAESREYSFLPFVISFFFGGAGMVFQVSRYLSPLTHPEFLTDRLQDACANGFIATLSKDSEFKMSMIHAAYGIVPPINYSIKSDVTKQCSKVLEHCLLLSPPHTLLNNPVGRITISSLQLYLFSTSAS